MEGLSEEERLKIQAVMACAELDAAATAVASAGPSAAVTPLSYVFFQIRFNLKIVNPWFTTSFSDVAATGDPFFSRTTRERTGGPAQEPRLKQDKEPSISARSDSTPSRSPSSISMQSDVSLPPMDGLSEKERAHIEAVMASAERDSMMSLEPQPTSEMMIPPGLEDLSEEERRQILAVMAAAGAEALAPPPPQIRRSGALLSCDQCHLLLLCRTCSPSGRTRPWVRYLGDDQVELPGLEGLSASEREQILAVMESARRDAEESRPPTAEPLPPPPPSAFTTITTPEAAPSISPSVPPGLEELSAEERAKIMAVMASAAMEEQQIVVPPPMIIVFTQRLYSQASHTEQEKRRPSDHMERGSRGSNRFGDSTSFGRGTHEQEIADKPGHRILWSFREDAQRFSRPEKVTLILTTFFASKYCTNRRSEKPMRVAEPAREQSPEEEIPGVDLSHLSPSEREQIRAVMRMAQMDDPGRREGLYQSKALVGISIPIEPTISASQRAQYDKTDTTSKPDAPTAEKKPRQTSMTSSSELGSPTRESGYGTTSTSYDHELGDFATKTERMYDVLEDAGEVREGAHSRNDSRADDRREDFDFTYSDARFSDLNDDNFDTDRYKVSLHDESGVSVDAVEMDEEDLYSQQRAEWTGGRTRMWTTVFEGDESEQPADDVFIQHSPTG
ncbi:hypothetical protein OSTOST_17393 [Ostertagia ostertagi]